MLISDNVLGVTDVADPVGIGAAFAPVYPTPNCKCRDKDNVGNTLFMRSRTSYKDF